MTPTQSLGWTRGRRQAGIEVTLYVNRSNWSVTRDIFTAASEPEPWWWVSTLDGTQLPLTDRVVACQYIGEPGSGGHYDLSIVRDFWPGVDGGSEVALLDPPQSTQLQEVDDLSKASHNMLRDGVNPGEPSYLQGVIKVELDQIKAKTDGIGPTSLTQAEHDTLMALPATLTTINQKLDALSAHLGVGHP